MENNFQINQNSDLSKNKYWKFFIKFLLIVMIVYIGFKEGVCIYRNILWDKTIGEYKGFKIDYLKFGYISPLGEATPQETYNKYTKSLVDNDILSASRYFYEDYLKSVAYEKFQKMKDLGTFEIEKYHHLSWIMFKEIDSGDENIKKMVFEKINSDDRFIDDSLDPDNKVKIPKGEYRYEMIFIFNKSANIWQILKI